MVPNGQIINFIFYSLLTINIPISSSTSCSLQVCSPFRLACTQRRDFNSTIFSPPQVGHRTELFASVCLSVSQPFPKNKEPQTESARERERAEESNINYHISHVASCTALPSTNPKFSQVKNEIKLNQKSGELALQIGRTSRYGSPVRAIRSALRVLSRTERTKIIRLCASSARPFTHPSLGSSYTFTQHVIEINLKGSEKRFFHFQYILMR